MIDSDMAFATELARQISWILQGDEDRPGLYHVVATGIDDFNRYNRIVGEIKGYNTVLGLMEVVAKQVAEGEMRHERAHARHGIN